MAANRRRRHRPVVSTEQDQTIANVTAAGMGVTGKEPAMSQKTRNRARRRAALTLAETEGITYQAAVERLKAQAGGTPDEPSAAPDSPGEGPGTICPACGAEELPLLTSGTEQFWECQACSYTAPLAEFIPAPDGKRRCVKAVIGGETYHLSVTELMESELAGPEWSWITLGEIAEHGHGIDTDAEVWTGDPLEVARQMRAYWQQMTPELREELDAFAPR